LISDQNTLTTSLLDAQHLKELVVVGEDRPASSLVVTLGKALNGIASTFELDWQ